MKKINKKAIEMVVYIISIVFTIGSIGYVMGDNYIDLELICGMTVIYVPAILTGMGFNKFYELIKNYSKKDEVI